LLELLLNDFAHLAFVEVNRSFAEDLTVGCCVGEVHLFRNYRKSFAWMGGGYGWKRV